MKTFKYKGYKITVFENYNGNQMFIDNPNGIEIWAHKFNGDAFDTAKRIINQN